MKPLIVIAGPTACGKTQTAVELALKLDGEVISADSMQVYKGMDIGTAKPTPDERKGVPHHLIDVVYPDEDFSAAKYQVLAEEAIASVYKRGKVPILTGGTGFYINGVVYGNAFVPTADDETEYRASLVKAAAEKGNTYLHERLREVDPDAAEAIHPNNVKRVARTLSFYDLTGERLSCHNAKQQQNAPAYDMVFVVLCMERERLYDRINTRVTAMLDAGLASEVRGLLDAGYREDLVSMQGLGYKETARYLRGTCTLAEAAEAIRTGTRRYAKRQMTWFNHRAPDAYRLNIGQMTAGELADEIIRIHELF